MQRAAGGGADRKPGRLYLAEFVVPVQIEIFARCHQLAGDRCNGIKARQGDRSRSGVGKMESDAARVIGNDLDNRRRDRQVGFERIGFSDQSKKLVTNRVMFAIGQPGLTDLDHVDIAFLGRIGADAENLHLRDRHVVEPKRFTEVRQIVGEARAVERVPVLGLC